MTPESLLTLIIAHAIQILIVCGLAGIMIRFAPSSHPRFVSGLWLIVLIKCLLPPLIPGPLSEFLGFAAMTHQPNTAETRSQKTASVEPAVVVFAESDLLDTSGRPSPYQRSALSQTPPQSPNNVFTQVRSGLSSLSVWCEQSLVSMIGRKGTTFILLLLFVGAVHRFIATCIQFSRSMQDIYRRRHAELSATFQHRVNMLCDRLRLRSIPEVVVSESMYGPAVMGLRRKVIVLPACLVTRLSADTLDPILAHELLHIRRKDLWTGLLQTVAMIFWWFHPAVRFLNDRLTRSIERCCDETVISEFGCSRSAYARCLLAVIEGKHQVKPIPVLPGMRPVEITSLRMERIMKPGTQTVSRSLTFRHAALLFLIAVVTLPGLGSHWTANGAQQSKQPQSRTSLPAQTAVAAASQQALPTPQQAQLLISMLLLKGEQESISALIEESSNTSATLRQLSDIPVVFDRSENHLLMQILNGVQQPPADLQVISRPRLRVISGSSGTIQIGQQGATDGDGPGAVAEFHGLSIDVTPSLTSDQNVDFNLSIKLSEPLGASQVALISSNGNVAETFTQPQTRLVKVSTNFSMLTNQAALIRGRSEKTPEVKGEILLMMHVEVVDENHPADQLERPESGVDEAAQMTLRYYAISDIEVAAGQRINGDSKTGDYTPLLEFIRSATGGARTWGKPFNNESGGTMMIDENSQALIVRQTAAVHDQIAALLRTLRKSEEQIAVQCTVFTVPSTSTSVAPWMDQNLKFQFPIHGRPWAQLTPEQSTQFLTALTSDNSVSQLLTPRLTVFSRQSAMIQTQIPNRIGPGGFSMTVQPTIRGDEVIELSHQVVVGNEDPASAKTQSALVLDGQLLIVQLDRSPGEQSSTSQPDAVDQRSYLMLQAIRKGPEAEEEFRRPNTATPE